MDELDFEGKKYLSSKRAAEVTGYAKDYVGQLCREGRVEARLVGRAWYVSEASIQEHRFGTAEAPQLEEVVSLPVVERDVFAKKEVATTWGTSTYAPEQVDLVPTLQARTSVDVFSERITPSPVHHMQSVWQDWFDTKNKENEAVFTEVEEEVEEVRDEEVVLTRIEEPETTHASEEEQVPIYKIPMRAPTPPAPSIEETKVEEIPSIKKKVSAPPVRRQRKTGRGSFITQALIAAFTLIFVSVTFIALGYGRDVLHVGNSFLVDYISGVTK